jgi:pimeloyl-ACP methyl ester carboxylesterase
MTAINIGRMTLLLVLGGLFVLLLAGPLLVPVRPLPGLRPPAELVEPGGRIVEVPFPGTRGLQVHVREAGEGDREFLLLHGFTFNSWSWAAVMPGLARHGRVVAYDRVPFGLSEKLLPGDWSGPNPYTADAALRQLEALRDALGLRRPVLVGNSAGAFLAARAVLAAPGRYAGLVLVGPAILRGPSQASVPLLRTPQLRHVGPLLARRVGRNGWLLRRSYAHPERITAEQARRCAIATEATNWDAALWEAIASGTAQPDISAEVPRIAVPTLIIGGERDAVVPASDFRRLAEMIPGAELTVLPDVGHVPQEEAPEEFLSAMERWLS